MMQTMLTRIKFAMVAAKPAMGTLFVLVVPGSLIIVAVYLLYKRWAAMAAAGQSRSEPLSGSVA